MDFKAKFARLYKEAMREVRNGDMQMAAYFQGHLDAITDIILEIEDDFKAYDKMYRLREKLSNRRYE